MYMPCVEIDVIRKTGIKLALNYAVFFIFPNVTDTSQESPLDLKNKPLLPDASQPSAKRWEPEDSSKTWEKRGRDVTYL